MGCGKDLSHARCAVGNRRLMVRSWGARVGRREEEEGEAVPPEDVSTIRCALPVTHRLDQTSSWRDDVGGRAHELEGEDQVRSSLLSCPGVPSVVAGQIGNVARLP